MSKEESPISPYVYSLVGNVIKDLGEAISESTRHSFTFEVNLHRAKNALQECLSEMEKKNTPKLTEEEGNRSYNLHVYMRKCLDTPVSSIIYKLVSESRGIPVWNTFIKSLSEKLDYYQGFRGVDDFLNQSDYVFSSDDYIMYHCLSMFDDDFSHFKKDSLES